MRMYSEVAEKKEITELGYDLVDYLINYNLPYDETRQFAKFLLRVIRKSGKDFRDSQRKIKLIGTSIFFITDEGQALAKGGNVYGNLGLGTDKDNYSKMEEIMSLCGRKVLQICSSPEHTLFLTENKERILLIPNPYLHLITPRCY